MIINYLMRLFPVALDMLGPGYDTPEARAMLLAVALQESACVHRVQHGGGPAKSFWQFEPIGIAGLFSNAKSRAALMVAVGDMAVKFDVTSIHAAIEHNDVLAIICARRLLAQIPEQLPEEDEAVKAWDQYLSAWRPGKPRPEKWQFNYARAWQIVKGV